MAGNIRLTWGISGRVSGEEKIADMPLLCVTEAAKEAGSLNLERQVVDFDTNYNGAVLSRTPVRRVVFCRDIPVVTSATEVTLVVIYDVVSLSEKEQLDAMVANGCC